MNSWQVYEFCKDHKDTLLQLPTGGQMKYLRKQLPGVDRQALAEGLAEFRSVPPHNWGPQVARAVK